MSAIRKPLLLATALAIGACSSLPSLPDVGVPLPNFSIAELFGDDRTDEQKAWEALLDKTSARSVGDDRLIIEAWGTPATSLETIELRLLARAGAEADRLGKSYFAIAHIRDRNSPVSTGLSYDSFFGADERWIGTYEDLVRSRYERDYGLNVRAWLGPAVSAVVIALDSEDLKGRDAFEALRLYELLNGDDFVG